MLPRSANATPKSGSRQVLSLNADHCFARCMPQLSQRNNQLVAERGPVLFIALQLNSLCLEGFRLSLDTSKQGTTCRIYGVVGRSRSQGVWRLPHEPSSSFRSLVRDTSVEPPETKPEPQTLNPQPLTPKPQTRNLSPLTQNP